MISHVLIFPVLLKLYLNSLFVFVEHQQLNNITAVLTVEPVSPQVLGVAVKTNRSNFLALGADSMAALRVCQLLATRSGDLPWLLISLLTTLKKQLNS